MSLLALVLLGCTATTTLLADRCDVQLIAASPDSGFPADRVQITARPLTSAFDTSVWVGDTRATVYELQREDCDACDQCRAEALCNTCGDCDTCDLECSTSCHEWVGVTIPEVSPGPTSLRLFNSHGESGALPFTVEGTTTDTGDTGSDTGADTGDTATDTADTATDTGDTAG